MAPDRSSIDVSILFLLLGRGSSYRVVGRPCQNVRKKSSCSALLSWPKRPGGEQDARCRAAPGFCAASITCLADRDHNQVMPNHRVWQWFGVEIEHVLLI